MKSLIKTLMKKFALLKKIPPPIFRQKFETKTIPKQVTTKQVAPTQTTIPPIFHQTFETNALPRRMYNACMSWVKHNPHYEYRFADDHDRRSLIEQHFDSDVLHAYDRSNVGAMRADLWRYCVLYVYGGVYMDIDTLCVSPLIDLILPSDEFIVPLQLIDIAVSNDFICSIAGHAFLQKAIELSTRHILDGKVPGVKGLPGVTSLTGPRCLGRAINQVLDRNEHMNFKLGSHCVNGHSFKILKKEFVRNTNKYRKILYDDQLPVKGCRYFFDRKKTICWTCYHGYHADRNKLKNFNWRKTPRDQILKKRAKAD